MPLLHLRVCYKGPVAAHLTHSASILLATKTEPCPPGTYAATRGALVCLPCLRGMVSGRAAARCVFPPGADGGGGDGENAAAAELSAARPPR